MCVSATLKLKHSSCTAKMLKTSPALRLDDYWMGRASEYAADPAADIYNIHTATFPASVTLLDAWLLNTEKDVLIGTTYKNQKATAGDGGGSPATVVADLKTVYGIAYSGHPRVRGILQWAAADYGNDALFPADPDHYKWGLFDTSTVSGVFNARQHKTNQIISYTRGSIALSKKV